MYFGPFRFGRRIKWENVRDSARLQMDGPVLNGGEVMTDVVVRVFEVAESHLLGLWVFH
jgi:hypothetical protein